ncbi:MAG: anti-sigma factor [Octadecabacter sp.]
MSDETDIPEDDAAHDDVLAAELSLGLLEGDALTQAQRRARIDQSFSALVEGWDIRFSSFVDEIAPVTPPKGLFKKITSDAYPESPKRIWQKLGIVPAFLGAGAAALVLFLALQYGLLTQPNAIAPTMVAEMAAEDTPLVVAAAYVEENATLFVEWQAGDRIAGRDVELWLIAGNDAPVSLGVLSQGESITEVSIPAGLRGLLDGGVLALSDEPLGGSPTGAPTGAVLAAGELSTL